MTLMVYKPAGVLSRWETGFFPPRAKRNGRYSPGGAHKKPPGNPAAGVGRLVVVRRRLSHLLFTITTVTVFPPFLASFRGALGIIFEISPAVLAPFTSCF